VTVSVELAPAVTEAGLKLAVAPAGKPATVRLMLSAVPLTLVVKMVLLPFAPPATRDTAAGFAEIEKSFAGGGGWTVTVTVVLCVAPGAFPVTVIGYVPAAALPALTVSVELAPVLTEVGLTPAVAPAGTPVRVRSIVSALPDTTAVEMVLVPTAPAARLSAAGFAEMEKSLMAAAPHPGNLNEPILVFQLKAPFAGMYSVVNQKVQSSTGSTPIIE
jgi:hypothetical protein